MTTILDRLIAKYPALSESKPNIEQAFDLLVASFQDGGKLLLCGNGGSAADCDHIVGELMKGFQSKRPLSSAEKEKWGQLFGDEGTFIADHLQQALPAISLANHPALMTAYMNDVHAEMIFAQQVYGYGMANDVLLGISTSGHSQNVVQAVRVAAAKELRTIGLTGADGGKLAALCDVTIRVPATETADVQEYHLPVYHALCLMVEEVFFG